MERIYADGAYNSETNRQLDAELILTSIQGKQGRYQLRKEGGDFVMIALFANEGMFEFLINT